MTEIELARAALTEAAEARQAGRIEQANHWAFVAQAHAAIALVEYAQAASE